jgi:hypothetical protein
MSLPKNSAASGLLYGIVVGGDQSDPDPDQANGLRVYFPTIHGKDVNPQHLAFSPRILSPDRAAMQSFSGGLDPGSLVVAYKDTGSSQCQILGLASDLNNYESNVPGNIGLLQIAPVLAQFLNKSTGVSRPPTIQQTTEGGAKVFKINERGDHNHNLLKGLPTHGALFPLNGIPIDPIKGIRTAIEAATNIPTEGLLNSLPGIAISLGSLLNMILSIRAFNKQLKNKIPPQTFNALGSMSALIQNMEQGESSGFMTSGRVNPDVYIVNAVELLSQCTNISDLMTATVRLQSDDSLFGMEKYGPTVVEDETQFGKIKTSYGSTGDQMTLTPATVAQGLSVLSGLMSSVSGFPSVVPGQNLFGQSSGTILNMIQRLAPGQASAAINLLNQVNTSGVAQELHKMIEKVVEGGNPIDHVK